MPLTTKEKLLVGAGIAGLCWGVYQLYRYIRPSNDNDGDDATPPPPPPPSSDLTGPPTITPPPHVEEVEIQAMEENIRRRDVERRRRELALIEERARLIKRLGERHRRAMGDEAGPSGSGH